LQKLFIYQTDKNIRLFDLGTSGPGSYLEGSVSRDIEQGKAEQPIYDFTENAGKVPCGYMAPTVRGSLPVLVTGRFLEA